LVHPGEALDGRSVEADAFAERALQLGRGHRNGLEETKYVGEPQPDEPDVALLERTQHELLLAIHGASVARMPPLHHGPALARRAYPLLQRVPSSGRARLIRYATPASSTQGIP